MNRVQNKVAFITGAARGQGRAHAVRLAEEGADIIAIDIASQVSSVPYPMGTEEDLGETVRQVEALGRRIVARVADVRDLAALQDALEVGVAQLGSLDIVIANAGIFSDGPLETLSTDAWNDMIDINLTGVFHTIKASIPHLRAGGHGGSIVLISSSAGLKGAQNIGHYVSSKHGLVGLMRTAALELAGDNIRVNSIHPTTVDTPMVQNETMYGIFGPDLAPEERTEEALLPRFTSLNAMPVPWVDAVDIANAALWLASDEARYVTGTALSVDAGTNLL